MKYCLPIILYTKKAVLEKINQNLSDYSYFEIWLDYIGDLDTEFIDYLISNFEEKLIFLLRRQNLEEIKMNTDQRQKIIWQISNTKSYLDLDFLNQEEDLNYIKEKNIKPNLILSYHNYNDTPRLEDLNDLIDKMKEFNPNIFKVACFCNREMDAVKLFNLLIRLKEDGKRYIVLGMGENGLAIRIFGTLWGNEMIFAPKEENESSAPGQLTKEQLEKIFEIIR